MKQIIHLSVGQAGLRTGFSSWKLFKQESQNYLNQVGSYFQSKVCMEHQQISGLYTPRALFIDLQPTIIDQIKKQTKQSNYAQAQFINGKEDSGNNFIRGHYTLGRQVIEQVQNSFRLQLQKCELLSGIIMDLSLGGGTGSGLGTLILQRLDHMQDIKKKGKLLNIIIPSRNISDSIVEPYNAMFGLGKLLGINNCMSVIYQNEALYKTCEKDLEIESPGYQQLNNIIANNITYNTKGVRFASPLTTFRDMCTNLIPYPKFQFLISSAYAENKDQISLDLNKKIIENSLKNSSVLENSNHDSMNMAVLMSIQGNLCEYEAKTIFRNLRIQKTLKFVDWCTTGFKICKVTGEKMGCGVLRNQTGTKKILESLSFKYDKLYEKRAFIHWYVGEGLSEDSMFQQRQMIQALRKDYQQAQI